VNAYALVTKDEAGKVHVHKHAGFSFERVERFDPFPRWVPARPMLEAVASPTD
jgi:hypothetical protein